MVQGSRDFSYDPGAGILLRLSFEQLKGAGKSGHNDKRIAKYRENQVGFCVASG